MTTHKEMLAFVEHVQEVSLLEAKYLSRLDPVLRRELPALRAKRDAEAALLRGRLMLDVAEVERDQAERDHDVSGVMPRCPKCGSEMQGGAPHGPWPVQYECRVCGHVVVPPSSGLASELVAIVGELATVNFAATPEMAPLAELILRAKNAVGFAAERAARVTEYERIGAAAAGEGGVA